MKFQFFIFAVALFGLCDLSSAEELEVPEEMFVWKKGFHYDTTLWYTLRADKIEFRGRYKETSDRWLVPDIDVEIREFDDKSVEFGGFLQYRTILLEGNQMQGKAFRYYIEGRSHREIGDLELVIKGTKFHQRLISLFRDIPGEGEEFSIKKKGLFNSEIHISVDKNKYAREFENFRMTEILPELKNQAFLMEWDSENSLRRGMLTIKALTQNANQDYIESGEKVSPRVRELIEREVSMLYGAIYNETRDVNAPWVMDGAILGGLIHPALEAKFRGRVVAEARVMNQTVPPINSGDLKIDRLFEGKPANYHSIKILDSAEIGGRRIWSDLKFSSKAHDDTESHIDVKFDEEGTSCELWIDVDRQLVRLARFSNRNLLYQGKLPKIGELTVNGESNGALSLHLEYMTSTIKLEGVVPVVRSMRDED